ncbi:TIGR00180 family glycosyltransferase [Thiovibrio sp. JS02]
MTIDPTTILVPTCNRAGDLEKLVHYLAGNFNHSLVRIIVLDGSDRKNERAANQSSCARYSVEYLRYGPEVSYLQRILNGLNEVITETVTILGDDDILNPKGFWESVCFLHKYPDYAIAHGQYVGFNFSPQGDLKHNKTYGSNSVEESSPLARLFSFFSAYTAPTYYAVNRTQLLKKSFAEIVANGTPFEDYVSFEILVSAIPLLHGKLKRLESFYQARRFVPAPPDKYVVYAKYVLDEGFSERYNKLKKSIIRSLPAADRYASEKVADAVDFAFAAFFGQRITTAEMLARFQALKISN